MNKEAMRKWKEGTGIDLRDVYAQSEMGPCAVLQGMGRTESVPWDQHALAWMW